jgi:hypothetical protein
MPSRHPSSDRNESRFGFVVAILISLLVWGVLVLAIVRLL